MEYNTTIAKIKKGGLVLKAKSLSLFVTLLLLAEMLLPALAPATIAGQTDVLKELFKLPENARLERESDNGETTVRWTLDSDNSFGLAAFDEATEELLSYVEVYEAPRLAVDMPQAECQKYAENVIARMIPDKQARVRLMAAPVKQTQEENIIYHFDYERVEGQLPVRGDGIYVIFNASTGRVVRLELSWYNGILPGQAGIISAQEAGAAFSRRVPLQLEWIKTARGIGDLKFDLRPVYRMADDFMINAKTGEEIETYATETLPSAFEVDSKPVNLPPITPDKAITESQAESVARSGALVPAGYTKDQSYTLWSWGEQGRTREFVFTDTGQEKEIHVSVDMVTGQVIGISSYSYIYGEGKPGFTYASGLTKAQNIARDMAPTEFSQTRLQDAEADYLSPSYDFIRYIYGIPYRDNGIQVQLNEYTGELSGYYLFWERNLNIPDISAIIDTTGMRRILAENSPMKLVYMVTRNYDTGSLTVTEDAQLVYELENSARGYYDAVTGVRVEQSKIPAGAAGHWSEASFRSLAEKGIVNPGCTVNPNKPISRADFTKMLVLATYLYPRQVKTAVFSDVGLVNPYLGYIEQAYARGIVKGSSGKFYPDRAISRQEVAVILIKALKSEGRIEADIAIEASSFKDRGQIAAWAVNDVNLATQLGYIKGFNGYFRPTSNITWGEAAALLNAYINI